MRYSMQLLYLGIIFIPSILALNCHYYNSDDCKKTSGEGCSKVKTCEAPEDGKRGHCYALWKNDTNGIVVIKKGCWNDWERCYNRSSCVSNEHKPKSNYYFCCCEGALCNEELGHDPILAQEPVPIEVEEVTPNMPLKNKETFFMTIIYCIVPIGALCLIVTVSYYLWRRHKQEEPADPPDHHADPLLKIPEPEVVKSGTTLLELKARGRFGCVWKGKMDAKTVAVKIFPIQDKNSFDVERDFYSLPLVSSQSSILRFLSAETRADAEKRQSEFWLLSEYHEKGSLYDYLKGNTITEKELFKMAASMIDGLAFLHNETRGSSPKPSVAHRDLKSKNVLVKCDGSTCLADFGLAIKFYTGDSRRETHGQVGTRRYMAPEVLEGAICFDRESFLRIDIYACALVLWEMLSRCNGLEGHALVYSLPFEAEVGSHPSLEEMQEVVVVEKKRPVLKETWRQTEIFSSFCQTIIESWDEECESRLSASCILGRLEQLQLSSNSPQQNDTHPSTLPGQQETSLTLINEQNHVVLT